MKTRLQLAKGLADNTLTEKEKKIAQNNPLVVSQAQLILADTNKKERTTKRRRSTNGT